LFDVSQFIGFEQEIGFFIRQNIAPCLLAESFSSVDVEQIIGQLKGKP